MSENRNFSQCSINGICSINNAISSLHEVVLLNIKTLAFYLLKLKEFGITNDLIKSDITDILYGVFLNVSYNQDEYNEIILKLDKYITQSVYIYEKYCRENGIANKRANNKVKKIYNLISAIRDGEKTAIKKYKTLNHEQKNTYEIIYFLCKSIISLRI